ncbi:hypothetical protein PTKIN_Ptkin05aG0177300 [Pterospermum kingtungense]
MQRIITEVEVTIVGDHSEEEEDAQDEIGVDLVGDGNGQLALNLSAYSGPLEPCEGMQFDDLEGAETCYKAYSRRRDGRSKMAYQHFGDVVTFDATYLTNQYGMAFVPFTGVNHHHQSIMFGCALLVNETAESYIWLLTTWLEALHGRAPTTIITDDEKAMGKAIA